MDHKPHLYDLLVVHGEPSKRKENVNEFTSMIENEAVANISTHISLIRRRSALTPVPSNLKLTSMLHLYMFVDSCFQLKLKCRLYMKHKIGYNTWIIYFYKIT